MDSASKKINDLLKQYKSKQFKGWDKIYKGINRSRIFVSNSTASRGKSFLMSELKSDWFMQAADYSSKIYNLVCTVGDLEKESLSFWEKLQDDMDWTEIIQFSEGIMELNIPYLYEKTLEDLEIRKTMKKHFDQAQNIGSEYKCEITSKFDKALHKYIKCLSKRKSDLLKKINRLTVKSLDNDFSPGKESEPSTLWNVDMLESPGQEVFNDCPTQWECATGIEIENFPMNDTSIIEDIEMEEIEMPSKQINKQKLTEYQTQHSFINWNEIISQLVQHFQIIDDSEVMKKKLIKLLKNKWFIEKTDIEKESNIVSYFVNEDTSLETWWQVDDGSIQFAEISNGELRINIPKLFLQSKEKKNEVKRNSENLISEDYSQIIDSMSIQSSKKSIDSLLNTYIKRLFKRKNDFVNSIIKGAIPVENVRTMESTTPLQPIPVLIIPPVHIVYITMLPPN